MSDAPLIDATPAEKPGETSPTPLAVALHPSSSSISLAEYRGTKTAEIFPSAPEELAALLANAGVFDLGWRSLLRCGGEDRVRWLNGMVTNSVTDLPEGNGCYAFVLNAQGRIQGDLDIYRRADSLWLETDSSQTVSLRAFLDHYIIMDDVTLDPEDVRTAIGTAGPKAPEKLAAAGLPAPMQPMQLVETTWRNGPVSVLAVHAPLVPRFEIWVHPDRVLEIWNALLAVDAIPCGSRVIEQLRILEGTLAYGIDISNRDLPQETNQMRALHFAKGCYLGQEIVERIRSRGQVHRTFGGFLLPAEVPEKTPLTVGEQAIGELTSVARVSIPGVGERIVALGRVRMDALDRKVSIAAEGLPVTPAALPFDFARLAVQP